MALGYCGNRYCGDIRNIVPCVAAVRRCGNMKKILTVVFVLALISDDYDGGYSGGGRSSVFIHTHSSSCASSCACVSSCACACACAGGGRAGCTKKDFYQTNLKVEDLNEVLKK